MQIILKWLRSGRTNAGPDDIKDENERVRVWDVPTRVFHWSVAILVATSWYTADRGHLQLHLWSGLTLLTMLLFRVVWGIVGTTTARFSNFVHRPGHVFAYLKALVNQERQLHAGHNPAGGLMVVAMMMILFVQVGTGLFSNGGVSFQGPLALQISSDTSDQLTIVHGWVFNCILFFIWMHLVAIFFYLCVKGENLIRPIVTGYKHRKHLPLGSRLEFESSNLALAIVVALGSVVMLTLA